MREDFANVKMQIKIEDVVTYLLGEPDRGMYKFPSEKTGSIKIYPNTQSFYDFGRGVGGDAIRLWSHVRGVDNWTSIKEISAVFDISTALNDANRKNIAERIRVQEKAQKEHKQTEKREKKMWVAEVDRLKNELKIYNALLESPHIPPLSQVWIWCKNAKQLTEYRLDCLCKTEN